MPDFIAALLASATFCLTLLVLNALTRLAIQNHVAPVDMGENGFLQIGGALVLATATWRRPERRQAAES